jgi:DnaJ-domain-containing protein 1
MTGFPVSLMLECAKVKADILYVTARQDALEPVVGGQVSSNDVAVFANQGMVKLVLRRGARSAKKHEDLLPNSDILTEGTSQQSEESFKRLVREAVEAAARRVSGKKKRSQQSSDPPPKRRLDPYEVLGVSRGASAGELKQARDRQIEIAHPDKLHQFHPALIARATELTAEINWAYDTLKKKAAP